MGALETPAILVVDDDESILEMVSCVLRRNGYRVLSQSNPVRAIEVAAENEIQLVITDLLMPHLDGIELAQRLRVHPNTQRASIILLTASADADVLARAMREGVALTLTKPFEMNRLIDLVGFATASLPQR